MNWILDLFKDLILGGHIGISKEIIFNFSYKFIKWGLIIGYIICTCILINKMKKDGRYVARDDWNELTYKTKKSARIFIWITIVVLLIGLILFIGSGIIENRATNIANRAGENINMPGHGEAPRVDIE